MKSRRPGTKDKHDAIEDKAADSDPLAETDIVSTRIITNRELSCDGASFEWWAVGENPALVTVRSAVFGTLQQFTHGDAEAFAMTLAKKLLDQHYALAEVARKAQKPRDPEAGSSDT